MWFFIVLSVLLQITLISIFFFAKQGSDQGLYLQMALKCYESGEWYPMAEHVYSSYIWNPGFINWLILQWHILGTDRLNMLFNLLMGFGILFDIFWLSKVFFSKRVAYFSVILYCLLHSTIWSVVAANTEIPFLFLCLTGFVLVVKAIKQTSSLNSIFLFIISGILFMLGNYIRPLALIFLLSSIILMVIKKKHWTSYVSLILPYVILNLCVAFLAHKKIGYYVYQSTTSGVNLIMTSNDKAYGGVATSLLRDSTSTCFIKNSGKLTFKEKDRIWKERSFEWIKNHPFRFSGLYIMKMFGLYIEDSWADRPLLGGDGFVDKAAHGKSGKSAVIQKVGGMFAKSLTYYIVLVLFFVSIWKFKRELLTEKGYVLLILLLGTLITCLFSVSPRYHQPFLFAVVIWAAYGLDNLLIKRNEREC